MKTQLEEKEFIDREIERHFGSVEIQSQFYEAARYIISPTGNRYRSLVSLEIYKSLGGSREDYTESLIGIESLHAASLIFDDLPSFDNSHMRKGKDAVHVKFLESTAILAGLYLMNTGQYLLSRNIERHARDGTHQTPKIRDMVYEAVNTMLKGEELDLESDKTEESMRESMILKNELFNFACTFPGHILGKEKAVISTLKELAL